MRVLLVFICAIRGGHNWDNHKARERVGKGRDRTLIVGRRCKICGAWK